MINIFLVGTKRVICLPKYHWERLGNTECTNIICVRSKQDSYSQNKTI